MRIQRIFRRVDLAALRTDDPGIAVGHFCTKVVNCSPQPLHQTRTGTVSSLMALHYLETSPSQFASVFLEIGDIQLEFVQALELYMRDKVPAESAPAVIDAKIRELGDWRGKMLTTVRKIILAADREIIEEWKWMGSPVWSHDGIIAVATVLKEKVKLTFSHGASLPDPHNLFNATLEGGTWRAIDLFEGDKINERALKNLVRAGAEFNQNKQVKKKASARPKANKRKKR